MWIRLGNPSPREGYYASEKDEATNDRSFRPLPGPSVTFVPVPDGLPLQDLFAVLTSPNGVWDNNAEPGSKPDWVASDDAKTETALSVLLDVPAGEPSGYLPADSVAAVADKPLPGLDHTDPKGDA